jgi:hypothetical protein
MKIFYIPLSHPLLYWAIALIVSLYHGYRGYLIHRHYIGQLNGLPTERTWMEKIIIYFVYGWICEFVCSLSGFGALYAVCDMFSSIGDLSGIGTGTAIILSFLSLFGLTGIVGMLPRLLYRGKLWDKLKHF